MAAALTSADTPVVIYGLCGRRVAREAREKQSQESAYKSKRNKAGDQVSNGAQKPPLVAATSTMRSLSSHRRFESAAFTPREFILLGAASIKNIAAFGCHSRGIKL